MNRISNKAWGGFPITVIYVITALGLTGVHSQGIECYTCTDQGEGGCLPEHAVNVSCSLEYNVCVEAITAIKTGHDNLIFLKKGCGFGDSMWLDKTILFHGIFIFIQLNQCNSSLCNTDMDLQNYELAPDDNITNLPNEEQCYSCIGKTGVDCSPSNPPVVTCYNSYRHCFDGNVTVSIGNDTTVTPIKSCSLRYHCAVKTVTYGSATYEIRGACCSGELCNQDLSDQIQVGEIPFLMLLNDNNEDVIEAEAQPPWIIPTTAHTSTDGTLGSDGGVGPVLNSAVATYTSYTLYTSYNSSQAYSDQPLNMAARLTYSPWAMVVLVLLLGSSTTTSCFCQ